MYSELYSKGIVFKGNLCPGDEVESELLVSVSILGSSVLMKCDSSSVVFLFCPVSYFSHGDTGYYKAIR